MRSPYLHILDFHGRPIPTASVPSPLFEGASTGRRMSTWGTSTAGPNATLFSSLSRLRSRSRELIRNNPLVDGGVDDYVANAIGSGISPRWQLDDPVLKKEIHELWDAFVLSADYYETLSFYGLQSLIFHGLIDAGEILSRKVYRSASAGLPVPLQLQLIEADHLDETYNSIAPNGNEIRMGIEIDKSARRTAYWLWSEHPGEAFITARGIGERLRIPAGEISHIFRPKRAGQMRGRPWLASIIVKLHELDQYDDAEIVRKKTAAMFGGFIKETPAGMDPSEILGGSAGHDSSGLDIVSLEPGTFPVLPPGMDVTFSTPVDVGGSYDVWMKHQLRQVARGMGITYEQLTSDLSGVNYSSIRAGLLEFRRRVQQLQFEILIFQFCRPVAVAFMDAAFLSGALSFRDYFRNRSRYLKITWRPDGWPWVDPVKDQLAEQMAVRNGFKSRAQVVAERGGDVETVDREIAEDNARSDELGLVYDSDPRKMTKTGVVQKAEETILTNSVQTE